MERLAEKTSSLFLDLGLYIIRYIGDAASDAPLAFLRASPGSDDDIHFIFSPGAKSGLVEPGSVALAVVQRRAGFQITVRAKRPGGSLDAKLEVERLDSAAVPVRHPTSMMTAENGVVRPEATGPALACEIVGHVTRRGDVRVRGGAWLAGPDDPARIEGLGFNLIPPDGDLRIEYQLQLAGDTAWTQWFDNGQFVGTRGRALAIVGVRLRLSGSKAKSYSLSGSALFLGSPTMSKSGHEVELRSQAGIDPLIGLKVEIVALIDASAAEVLPGSTRKSRVRVFRAGSELATA